MSDARAAMERFWDERAREDAFHYVDTRTTVDATDPEAFWRGGQEVVDRMLQLLGVELRGDEEVLDIGCGVGRLTRALAQRARLVSALDVSQEMLAQARRYNATLRNVSWVHGDGTSLRPFPDRCFDVCVSFVVFQHIPDPEITMGYIREMGRVLRPGGWAAFQVSNDARIHKRPTSADRLRAKARAVARRGVPRQTDPAWLGSALTLDQLGQAAGRGGLRLERIENEGDLFCMVLARRA